MGVDCGCKGHFRTEGGQATSQQVKSLDFLHLFWLGTTEHPYTAYRAESPAAVL
jgi:hypothetical protein